MKFFKDCKTMQDLKAEYKKLAKQYHPDCGGDDETMALINAEYDRLAAILPTAAADGTTYQPQTREAPEAFRAAVAAILNMEGINVELCGNWLWVTGNTYPYKDQLKAAGYKFSGNKKAWYWHGEGYKARKHKAFTMDEIRAMHGSEGIELKQNEKISA